MLKKRLNIIPVIYLAFLILIIISFILIDYRIKQSVLALARSKAQLKTVELINMIVNEKVVANIQYQDIFNVHKDDQGSIVLLQANTVGINQIITQTTHEISKSLQHVSDDTIKIPLGQILGFDVLAAYGPKMNVKIIPVGEVNVSIRNTFEEAGINQSRHLIYFEINTKMRIAVPFLNDEINIAATVPLAETIIVGKVPETYINMSDRNSKLAPLLFTDITP